LADLSNLTFDETTLATATDLMNSVGLDEHSTKGQRETPGQQEDLDLQ